MDVPLWNKIPWTVGTAGETVTLSQKAQGQSAVSALSPGCGKAVCHPGEQTAVMSVVSLGTWDCARARTSHWKSLPLGAARIRSENLCRYGHQRP